MKKTAVILSFLALILCLPAGLSAYAQSIQASKTASKFCAIKKGEIYGSVPVAEGSQESADVGVCKNVEIMVCPDDSIDIKTYLPQFVYAPVVKGARAGAVEIYVNGKAVKSAELIYLETVMMKDGGKQGLADKLIRWWYIGNSYGQYFPVYP